jgi:hypothetical protein
MPFTGDLGELLIPIKADLDQLDKGLKSAQDKLRGASQKMTSIGKGMTLGITAPIIGIGAAAAKMGMDLESEFAKIEGLVGVPKAELEGMRVELMDISKV